MSIGLAASVNVIGIEVKAKDGKERTVLTGLLWKNVEKTDFEKMVMTDFDNRPWKPGEQTISVVPSLNEWKGKVSLQWNIVRASASGTGAGAEVKKFKVSV